MLTERLDYFSATATIMFVVYGGFVQILGFEHKYKLGVVFAAGYLAEVYYLLSKPYFDYGWNMTFNIILIVVQIPVWARLFSFLCPLFCSTHDGGSHHDAARRALPTMPLGCQL